MDLWQSGFLTPLLSCADGGYCAEGDGASAGWGRVWGLVGVEGGADLVDVGAVGADVFRILKRVFGFDKVRYRGIAKNHHRLCANFALVNLYLHRKRLLVLGQ